MVENEQFPMIAKTLAELEDVLAEELIGLGADNVVIGTRMVSFTGDNALMYKANLHCRTALRILKPIYEFKAETADEVYEAIKQLNWENYLSLNSTFSIDAVVFSHIFNHSKFVAYRVKDAIADWFMERYEKRPSVSLTNPDVMLNIHVSHNKCTLSLDSSGESLHKRGYRIAQTEAPLSEVLAAGMILKSGWRGESAFIDPMCGSGTILIEAAMIALGIPPGIHRPSFAFEKWSDFDKDLFSEIYNDDSGNREMKYPIIGSDISSKAISIAEKNIRNAGLKNYIELSVRPLQQYTEAPAETGIIITNPPYGERIKVDELDELYSMIGERFKHVFAGYRAYILSYRKESFSIDNLSALSLSCRALSSPETYSVRIPLSFSIVCSTSVDLPIPGSPPSRTTDAGTSPPPNTRSFSDIKSKPLPLKEIKADEEQRIDMRDEELNRVLGGGLVPASVVLLGGEPGIGKSTLVLQTILKLRGIRTLYVSGEESARQLKLRADRLSIENDSLR
jgi:putative N6-adenine-specific DNA methylase